MHDINYVNDAILKRIFTYLLFFLPFLSFAQNSYNIVTDKVRIDDMVWSSVDEEFLFFEKVPRRPSRVVWEFTLNDNNTGVVRVTELEDGDKYAFTIYDWRIKQDTYERDYVWMEAIQVSNSEKVTIMVQPNHLKQHMISVFMPDSKICIFFDNMIYD